MTKPLAVASILGSLAGYGIGYWVATRQERPLYGGNGKILEIPAKIGLALPISFAIAVASPQKPPSDTQMQDFATVSILGQLAGYGIEALLLQNNNFT